VHGHQVTLHQVPRGQGAGSHDDQDLVKVGCDDMLALAFIGPHKAIFPWQYGFGDQAFIICAADQDTVTAKGSSNLAPELAGFAFSIRHQYDALAAIGNQYQGFCAGFVCHVAFLDVCMRSLYLPVRN